MALPHAPFEGTDTDRMCNPRGAMTTPVEDFEVEIDRTELHRLLRPLVNVKNLRINHRLVKEFSHYLQLDDEELPPELLPELQELTYFDGSSNPQPSHFITFCM